MTLFVSRRSFPLLCLAVGLTVFGVSYTLLGQVCTYCTPDCSQTTHASVYEDEECSCPTRDICKDSWLCTECFYNGVISCVDEENNCSSVYVATLDSIHQCCAC